MRCVHSKRAEESRGGEPQFALASQRLINTHATEREPKIERHHRGQVIILFRHAKFLNKIKSKILSQNP